MQQTLFQIGGIFFLLFLVVQFVRQQQKSGDMPFKKYWPIYLLWTWCVGVFAYGIIFFIDAPLHESIPQQPCAVGEFCGKTGRPHTKEEFEAFVVWQKILIFSWIIGVPAMAAANLISKKKKD